MPPRQLVILLQSTLPLQKVGKSKVSRLHQQKINHLTPETSFLTYKWSHWSKSSLPTNSCVSSIATFPIVARSSETERLILYVLILSLLHLVSYIPHKFAICKCIQSIAKLYIHILCHRPPLELSIPVQLLCPWSNPWFPLCNHHILLSLLGNVTTTESQKGDHRVFAILMLVHLTAYNLTVECDKIPILCHVKPDFLHSPIYTPEQIHLWATALLTNTSGKGAAKSILLKLKMVVGKYETAHTPSGMKLSWMFQTWIVQQDFGGSHIQPVHSMGSDERPQLLAQEHFSACDWSINTTLPKRDSLQEKSHKEGRHGYSFLED